jgi:molybdopterin synthase catalytic subunit
MSTVGQDEPPLEETDTWLALSGEPLPLEAAHGWLVRPQCGAVVQFTGTARDHSEGRTAVELLTYEAYETEAIKRMDAVVSEMRTRWPAVVRIAILHRTGDVAVCGAAVHVGVSAPHRDVAFEAARFGIDALKASVPIWKRERHGGEESWGLDGAELADASDFVPTWAAGSMRPSTSEEQSSPKDQCSPETSSAPAPGLST